eukprot:SAG11_NODE_1652_length_4509_cov_3.121088_2_plen_51_part_00
MLMSMNDLSDYAMTSGGKIGQNKYMRYTPTKREALHTHTHTYMIGKVTAC